MRNLAKKPLALFVALVLLLGGGISWAALNPMQPEQDVSPSVQAANDLTITSVSPPIAADSGSVVLNIQGENFPDPSTANYEQDGLKFMIDGVNNAGSMNSVYHNSSATAWKDLKNNTNLTLTKAQGDTTSRWTNFGYFFDGSSAHLTHFSEALNLNWLATDGQERTIEYVIRRSGDIAQFPFFWVVGDSATNSNDQNSKWFWAEGSGNTTCGWAKSSTTAWLPYLTIEDGRVNSIQLATNSNKPATFSGNGNFKMINNSSPQNGGTGSGAIPSGYLNRISIGQPEVRTNTSSYNFEFLGMRIYNKILTEAQRLKNYNLDQTRLISPPTMKIAGQQCSELTITSTTTATCTLPTSVRTNQKFTGENGGTTGSWTASTNGLSDVVMTHGGKNYTLSDAVLFMNNPPADVFSSSSPSILPRDVGGTATISMKAKFPSNSSTLPSEVVFRPNNVSLTRSSAQTGDLTCANPTWSDATYQKFTCILPRLTTPANLNALYSIVATQSGIQYYLPRAFSWNNSSPSLDGDQSNSAVSVTPAVQDKTLPKLHLSWSLVPNASSFCILPNSVINASQSVGDKGISYVANSDVFKFCPLFPGTSADSSKPGATGWFAAYEKDLDFSNTATANTYAFTAGQPLNLAIIARNNLGNVDVYGATAAAPNVATNVVSDKIHSVTFDRNSDTTVIPFEAQAGGSANIPTWASSSALSTVCIETAGSEEAAKTSPITQCDQITLYIKDNTSFGTDLPAVTLNGYTSGGWYYSTVATPCNRGVKPGYPSSVGDNVPGNSSGNCTNELKADTPITQNLTAFQKWTYTPTILDFSPKKGLKNSPTTIRTIGEGFIPWGYTLETAKSDPNFKLKIGSTPCTSSTLVSNTEAICTTNGGEGEGKLGLQNSATTG